MWLLEDTQIQNNNTYHSSNRGYEDSQPPASETPRSQDHWGVNLSESLPLHSPSQCCTLNTQEKQQTLDIHEGKLETGIWAKNTHIINTCEFLKTIAEGIQNWTEQSWVRRLKKTPKGLTFLSPQLSIVLTLQDTRSSSVDIKIDAALYVLILFFPQEAQRKIQFS